MKISVIGLGYIGLPTAAVLASRKVEVVGVDVNQNAVDMINRGEIHIVEPELGILVRATVQTGYLRATMQAEKADAFMVAVPTPFKGEHEPDLSYIKSAAEAIAPVLEKGNMVILESTSPVGATEKMMGWMKELRPDLSFPVFGGNGGEADISVAHCPERVLPGHVVRELVENQGLRRVQLIGYVRENGKLPDLDFAMIATFASIAGAGGLSNVLLSNYAREGGGAEAYLQSSDPVDRITHPIPFPDQRLLRSELVAALKDLGRMHIYGGLGHGTFAGIPRSAYRGFRTYAELPGVYAAAKININHHNSPASRGYLNQRDTAIAGSGGFMLTDYVEGIEEVFELGVEIDTWKTREELEEKARWWLGRGEERAQAGRRAQERVLREYGNVAYARKLLAFIEEK